MGTIVVTGATGSIGSRVVSTLAGSKEDVVAFVRDRDKARALESAGARLRAGSFEDEASLRAAFSGADSVVLITPPNARATEQTLAALAAAKASGVRKIVRVSALKASVDGPTDNTRQHGQTEAALRESGLAYVILRPHLFMQNLLGSAATLKAEGKFYFGVGDGKMGMIDTRDVADAVALAATRDDWDGQTIELTGPAAIDYHAVAAAIGSELGRPIAYVALPPAAAGEALRSYGADDWTCKVVADYCTAYAKGWGDFTTDGVQRVTGRAPRSIADFTKEVLAPALR